MILLFIQAISEISLVMLQLGNVEVLVIQLQSTALYILNYLLFLLADDVDNLASVKPAHHLLLPFFDPFNLDVQPLLILFPSFDFL